MISWPAKVLANVNGTAIVQVPGGLFPIPDPTQRLQVGDATTVVVDEARSEDESLVGGIQEGRRLIFGVFAVSTQQNAIVLSREGVQVPLIVRPDERMPSLATVGVLVLPAEVDEGSEQSTPPAPNPASTGLPECWDHLCPEQPRVPTPFAPLPFLPPCDSSECWAHLLNTCE